jgi:superfamily II DNA or RNA helicase
VPVEPGSDAPVVLAVRPAILGESGRWKTSGISWGTVQYHVNRLSLAPRQTRWFHQVSALRRSTPAALGDDPDRILLDEYESPLLWELLRGAAAAGIELIAGRSGGAVRLGEHAEVLLDATIVPGALTLETVVLIDGERRPLEGAGRIGDHGLYSVVRGPDPAILLAPSVAPLTREQQRLLGRPLPSVPLAEADGFLRDVYPTLRQAIPIASTDGSVEFPAIAPPALVLVVEYQQGRSAELHWEWMYTVGTTTTRRASDLEPEPGLYRDPEAETERLDAFARDPLPGALVAGVPSVLRELDVLDFVAETLPRLSARGDLRIEEIGARPEFREHPSAPELTITAVPSDDPDWFDLGVLVTVDGTTVPFAPLFAALTRGAKKLLLIDRSYLSLEQPVFDRLREIIHDASTFPEWETGVLQVNRHNAAVWDELEELADHTEQDPAWRETVTGLLALADGRDPLGEAPAPTVAGDLRPYQRHGHRWLHFLWRHRLGGILADDMGLGKTVQTLSLIADAVAETEPGRPPTAAAGTAAPGRPPFLVLAPASVVGNWSAEAARFTPQLRVATIPSATVSENRLREAIADADIVVTSYALFRIDFERYRRIEWSGLILDEAQVVKNRAAQIHRCARDLEAPFKLAITGTPLENDLIELWALFAIVAPGLLPPAHRFIQHYARPIAAGEDVSATRLDALRRRVRPLMLRRTKEEVAPELPPKQEQVLTVELAPSHRRVYDAYLQRERQKILDLVDDLDRQRFTILRSLTLLRRLSLDASLIDTSDDRHGEFDDIPSSKLDALMEQLADVLAEGHRALVFSQFTSYLAKVADRLTAAGIAHATLDGTTRRRDEVIHGFRNGTAPVFLISLRAGGFGLNLTEADYVFLLDPWWNPAVEDQAVDRTHRIGQTSPVMVYRLVAADTIEEKVMALKAEKARLFDAVLDDGAAFDAALTADDIRALLG